MDISAGGVRIGIEAHLPVDSRVELSIAVSNPPATYRQEGRVRWFKEDAESALFLLGIEFTDSSWQVLEAWQQFVEQKLPPPHQRHDGRDFARES